MPAVVYTVLIFLLSTAVWATNFYVDNTVSTSGDGSFSNPWKTINEALPHLAPGDTLFIRGGSITPQVYNENLILNGAAGTRENPIVIRAYGSESVEIQYKNSYVVKFSSGGYVLEHLILNHLGGESDAIKIKSSYNVLRNCVIKNGKRDGIDLGSGDYNLVEHCKIYGFDTGTTTDAHGIVLDEGTGNTFQYNEIFDNGGDCIQIYTGTARWTVIAYNQLYTTLGGESENAVDIKSTVGVKLIGNEMFGFRRSAGSQGNAVVIHHDADSIIMRDNRIYDSNGGIRIGGNADYQPDYLIIERNIVYDLIDEGQYSTDGYGIQFDGLSNVQMYNNTFVNIPGPLFWIDSDGAENVDIRNNLFSNTGRIKGGESLFRGTVVIDYNGWFSADERFDSEPHPIIGTDPMFVNPDAGDFRLAPGSPAIDAGDPAFGTDYPGGRIDLGAIESDAVTAIEAPKQVIGDFQLLPNYPNPFNPATHIPFVLPQRAPVQLSIYDIHGRLVQTLVQGTLEAGKHQVVWNARNSNGKPVPSGVYIYQIRTPFGSLTGQMILMR